MNRKGMFFFVAMLFFLIFIVSCEEPLDKDNNYVSLEYTGFMKLSPDKIADSLAIILNVAPVTYNGGGSIGMFFHDHLKWAVKEGYGYIANDSAKITVWVDQEDNPCYVAYELERWGASENWSYSEDFVISEFKSIIEKAGGNLIDAYDLTLNKYAGRDDHWYELYLTQTYHDTAIGFPYFYSEMESDTSKVNFLIISRCYTNLDDITDTLSTHELKSLARVYFKYCKRVLSMPDDLTISGYYIIKDKLCRQVGSAVTDE